MAFAAHHQLDQLKQALNDNAQDGHHHFHGLQRLAAMGLQISCHQLGDGPWDERSFLPARGREDVEQGTGSDGLAVPYISSAMGRVMSAPSCRCWAVRNRWSKDTGSDGLADPSISSAMGRVMCSVPAGDGP